MKTLIAIVVLCTVYISPSNSLIKEWIPDISFENRNSWIDNKTPCPSDSIIFPEELLAVITLPKELHTKEIILPINGGLLMPSNSEIAIGENSEPKSGCRTNVNQKAIFKKPELKPWLLSENWKTLTDLNEIITNEAIPHLERIPCPNDIIRFKENTNFLIDLQDVNYLPLGKTAMYGNERLDSPWEAMGHMLFLNALQITKNVCPIDFDDCTCMSSGFGKETILDTLCENEKQFCKTPHCLNPIQPYGHCCKICGATAVITLESDGLKQSIAAKLNLKVKHFYEESYYGKIDGHVAIFSNDDGESFIQIIALDKGEYTGTSSDFIEEFKIKNLDSVYKSDDIFIRKSGKPYDPNAGISIWVILFGPLFMIAVIFFILHVHFIQEKKIFTLPKWTNRNFHLPAHLLSNPFVFARFDNTRRNSEYENITVGLDCALQEGDVGTASGFNNPLFDTKKSEKAESGEMANFKEVKLSDIQDKEDDLIDNIE